MFDKINYVAKLHVILDADVHIADPASLRRNSKLIVFILWHYLTYYAEAANCVGC